MLGTLPTDTYTVTKSKYQLAVYIRKKFLFAEDFRFSKWS
jgi:hypothetical protein